MKNVLLIGDSIRVGYDKAVRRTLEGKANVIFPEENCRFASYVLRHFHEYFQGLKGHEIDVVHWNAGLWDCLHIFSEDVQTPIDIYAYYIERVCVRIKKLCPNAKIIFATSTSVQDEKMSSDFYRKNSEIEAYNNTAIEIVKKHGFEVNDLYAVSVTLPAEAHSDPVHYYTPMGTQAYTNQVLSYICKALDIEAPEYREELHTDKPVGI